MFNIDNDEVEEEETVLIIDETLAVKNNTGANTSNRETNLQETMGAMDFQPSANKRLVLVVYFPTNYLKTKAQTQYRHRQTPRKS